MTATVVIHFDEDAHNGMDEVTSDAFSIEYTLESERMQQFAFCVVLASAAIFRDGRRNPRYTIKLLFSLFSSLDSEVDGASLCSTHRVCSSGVTFYRFKPQHLAALLSSSGFHLVASGTAAAGPRLPP